MPGYVYACIQATSAIRHADLGVGRPLGCAARAGVRGGLLRITRRNADVQRGGEESVLRRVLGEPRRSRLRARESLSEVAAAAPVMASPVLSLPAPGGPALEAGSPVTNDPGSGGWAVASWLLTAAWAAGPACSGHGSPARVAAGPTVPATGSAAGKPGRHRASCSGGEHAKGVHSTAVCAPRTVSSPRAPD
jgi:hypothetical protein